MPEIDLTNGVHVKIVTGGRHRPFYATINGVEWPGEFKVEFGIRSRDTMNGIYHEHSGEVFIVLPVTLSGIEFKLRTTSYEVQEEPK
jgi:hypothetical protein